MTPEEWRVYDMVHHWIQRKYGKAIKCETKDCILVPKRFEWALKKGFSYEKNIGNFIQLCPSCHRKYDWTEEQSKRVSEALHNRVYTPELRRNMSLGQRGRIIPVEIRRKMSETQKKRWALRKAQ